MINTKQLAQLMEENNYQAALQLFISTLTDYTKKPRLLAFREVLALTDEELRPILQVMDLALMDDVSGMLIRANHRKKKTVASSIWYCEELIDLGDFINAEDLLLTLIQEDLTKKEEEKVVYNLAIACIRMRRYQAAYDYLKKCEELTPNSMKTRWGYYYLQKGEWEEGVKQLLEGLQDKKDGAYAFGMLIRHYMLQGNLQEAKKYIDHAILQYPNFPRLQMEKIRYLYKTKEWSELREAVKELQHVTPFHSYQTVNSLWVAESLYHQHDISALRDFLQKNDTIATQSHFRHLPETVKSESILINMYKPTLQKNNYCVPASLEMVFSMYNQHVSQEEVAESIFTVSGSSISKAITLLEERGFYSRYFYSDAKLIKQMLQSGISVIMSLEYPTSSHVQVVVGYDDNLQCLIIQDPNLTDVLYVEYEKFQEEFTNSHALAIAVVPSQQAAFLHFLDDKEHEIAARTQVLGENCNEDFSEEDKTFIRENITNIIVAASFLKFLAKQGEEDLLLQAADVVEQSKFEKEYKYLIIAMAYVRIKKWGKAEEYLAYVKPHYYPSAYWYLKGRIHYEKNEHEEAASCFQKGITFEADDFVLWSYLALSTSFRGLDEQALRYSSIAMDINDLDTFTRINHGMILFDNKFYTEAREQFSSVLKEVKSHSHAWFERARCDKELERYRHAERGFRTAISLDPEIAVPYRDLSQLYEFVYMQPEKVEPLLHVGLKETDEAILLLLELGDFYERQKEYEKARVQYLGATEKYPEDSAGWVNLGHLLKEEGKFSDAYAWLNENYERFQDDSEYLVNAGKYMWEAALAMDAPPGHLEQALSLLEKGINCAPANVEDALELYVNLIEETPYNARGFTFLQNKHEEDVENYLYPSYLGCLYESRGLWYQAKECYELALSKAYKLLPLYRLGEILVKLGEDKEARKCYKMVLELDSTHVQAHLNIADICHRLNHKVQELFHIRKAFALNPYAVNIEYFASLLKKNELLELKEKLDSLLNERNASFVYDSLGYIYGALGDHGAEEEYVLKALGLEPDEIPLLMHRIQIILRKKKYAEAKKEILPLICKDIENRNLYELFVEIHVGAGSMLTLEKVVNRLKLSDQDKSMVSMYTAAAFDKVLMARREKEEYDLSERNWFKKLKNFGKASVDFGVLISLYENALKHDRENVTAVFWLADVYLQLEMKTDAIKSYEKFLKYHWESDVAYQLTSTILELLDKEAPEKKYQQYLLRAKELVERCLAEEEAPRYLSQYGYVLKLLGDFNKAESIYQQVIELESDDPAAYYQLSLLYRETNRVIEAKDTIWKALEIAPDDTQIMNEASIALRLNGEFHEALELVNKALEIGPEDAMLLYNRACYLSLLGEFEESATHLAELFEADEDGVFIEMSLNDEDLEPLKEAGMFPLEVSEQ
ncbi:tetratricopeptide repeat protein [Sutcliffiella horikoshii]|uniref:Tetratricopeptide repeat protein n=1 Tax=Sutcliffiella horikoshii TaxID=79883 RepID=A0A5D4SY46_9BACI|nr:tetratricopeptide repeat protein [Sutcliffiella horikoshii]TYS68303.1 tetratricopeptide repeat protein [Sutcliffiella horikoshii]